MNLQIHEDSASITEKYHQIVLDFEPDRFGSEIINNLADVEAFSVNAVKALQRDVISQAKRYEERRDYSLELKQYVDILAAKLENQEKDLRRLSNRVDFLEEENFKLNRFRMEQECSKMLNPVVKNQFDMNESNAEMLIDLFGSPKLEEPIPGMVENDTWETDQIPLENRRVEAEKEEISTQTTPVKSAEIVTQADTIEIEKAYLELEGWKFRDADFVHTERSKKTTELLLSKLKPEMLNKVPNELHYHIAIIPAGAWIEIEENKDANNEVDRYAAYRKPYDPALDIEKPVKELEMNFACQDFRKNVVSSVSIASKEGKTKVIKKNKKGNVVSTTEIENDELPKGECTVRREGYNVKIINVNNVKILEVFKHPAVLWNGEIR